MDTNRGTGRTTQQMQDAPLHAVFVWCNNVISYPRALARMLGRTDLLVVSPSQFHTLRGMRHTAVVVDHAAHLSEHQREFLALNFDRQQPPTTGA